MTHYRKFYNKNYLAGEDFEKDSSLVVTIKTAESEEVQSTQGLEEKLVIGFQEIEQKYIPGIRMAKIIRSITGSDQVEDWIGLKIELFQATEEHFGEPMEVIRVRRPVDRAVIKKIQGAKTRKDLEVIYKGLKSHEKTDKTITSEMIRIRKTLRS